MKVLLAGYNLDNEVIEGLKSGNNRGDNVTPEVLSASYARISRDPRPIDELRADARNEVEKTRRSNKAIIFKMGHHSVAEHAIFNFDLIGISRLALEEIEKFRLVSYTEKSQRYQRLEDNYLPGPYDDIVKEQNKSYQKMVDGGVEPEDARYITSLATRGQVGVTINARNLELLFRRFASSKLPEINRLGVEMFKQVEAIAPSIILFTQPNALDRDTYDELGKGLGLGLGSGKQREVSLEYYTPKADEMTVAALMYTVSKAPFKECLAKAESLSKEEKMELLKTALKNMEFYDATLREFEYVDLGYDLIVSSACFGQLKRHRMATLTCQEYDPCLGVTIPPAIVTRGYKDEFMRIVDLTNKAYEKLKTPYVLTGAHRKRAHFKCNARELYHISRLREDQHAQWDIQNISKEMVEQAKTVMPLTLLTCCGKDVYAGIYKGIFGSHPKVLPLY
ncbi:MAG: FAD-dependent thymidylate synthase [Candidatus Margulisbacteria bacterium]|nr:FAD-dependent thymidylate synthase [Candidatus Margulisiibacteriota bacterium]